MNDFSNIANHIREHALTSIQSHFDDFNGTPDEFLAEAEKTLGDLPQFAFYEEWYEMN